MDKKIVLLVDDDPDIAKMLKIRIEAEGYEFAHVGDSKGLFEVLNIKKPDVILFLSQRLVLCTVMERQKSLLRRGM